MSHHHDRSAMILKVALKQALRRILEEERIFEELEHLSGHLKWEEMASRSRAVRESLARTAAELERMIEEAQRLQSDHADHHHHHDE
ncbi:MAG: hypothetical protein WHT46_01510 [Candidatus Geothermincolales bacterium]